jgi:2-succinyl-6-hydroxy-2,4-cyclohexadiene-1-carboxylate synthase
MFRYKDRFRIIAPDQRGHGLSDKPITRYAGEDFAEEAFELIKQLKCRPVILLGHSLGGRNAAYLAALHPEIVKGLIILDTKAEGPENLSTLPPDKVSIIHRFSRHFKAHTFMNKTTLKNLPVYFQAKIF